MPEWFEDDDFWSTWYPYMFSEERLDQSATDVDQILALVDFDPKRVLDLACGPGRHAIELARRGYQVTGVDLSRFLLSKAEERGRAAGVEVEWVEEDMRNFERPDTFDLAINLFTSFGYFEDESDNLLVLKRLHSNLKPGGRLVMDVASKEWIAKNFEATSSTEIEDGLLSINRREIIDDWTRIRNEWILLRDSEVHSIEFQHTIYSGQELRDRLQDAGFQSVNLYGDLEGNEYGTEAKRLIAVANK